MKTRICTSCGYHGYPVPQSKETFLVDAMLWMVFGSLGFAVGLLPLLVVPLAWTIYHIAKFNTTQCPKCENLDMVSENSRSGRAVLNGENQFVRVWDDNSKIQHAQ